MNVIWSVAMSREFLLSIHQTAAKANLPIVLLFVLWYCYKRGREERLLRENSDEAIDGSDRIEELPDDPTLPAPEPRVEDPSAESASASGVARTSAVEVGEASTVSRRA